jgi:FtsP/CotA-like multicopper oxidase with cupredoxin domain
MFRVPARLVAALMLGPLMLVALLGVACGDGDPGSEAEPKASPTPEATETAGETSDESPSPEPEPKFTVEVTVANGEVEGPKSVEVKAGEKVSIAVTSDVADHVHVHGYDELVDLVPGKRAVLRFTANIPGAWEVELEDAGKLLFELKVQ